MAGSITSLGIGSGIDIETIVGQLIALERRPIQSLEAQQADIDIQISALGLVRDSIESFQTSVADLTLASGFRSFAVSSTDEDVLTATAGEGSVPITSDIEVLALAQRNKLASAAFANGDAVVGTGTLNISVGTNSFSVSIGDNENTLSGIRNAINENTGNTGISASIITADAGSYLILSSDESGTANALTITVTGDGDGNDTDATGLSALVFDPLGVQNLTEVDAAADASLTVDGFAVTRASNEIDDVIEGVTLSLKDVGTASLSVTEDRTLAQSSIDAVVKAYNDLIITLDTQRETTLVGESLLLSAETRVRQAFTNRLQISGSNFSYLFEVGLTFDRDGILSLDADKFDTVINDDFNSVVQLFTDPDNGFANSLDEILNSYLETEGIIEARTDGLAESRNGIDDDIERIEDRIELTEARIRRQFISLDTLVNQLNATSGFLTNQLNNLPTNAILNNN